MQLTTSATSTTSTTPTTPTTVGNIVFLLLSFPMGLLYFLLTVIGLTIGISTIVIWIGLPLLFVTLVLIRGMAVMERRIVASLLRTPFPAQTPISYHQEQRFLKRFWSILRDPLTWTSVIYMVLKLPVSIISFTLALVLPIVSASLTLLPITYLISLFVDSILLKSGISATSYIIPYFIEIHGQFDLVMFARSFIGVPVGLIAWFATRFLLNALAQASAEMARALL